MGTIFKREFKSYFTNMVGYVIVAALSFLIALYFCIYCIKSGYPYFGYALAGVEAYMMIIIPILTMRSLSDERKSKTDQLLLTSPASVTKIVLGKFLGMAAVYAIPLLMSCVYPIILLSKESHSMAIDFSCIAAFFLFGCVYISIGMFISSITESQIISAVVTFIVFFIFYLMSYLVSFIPEASYINAIGFTVFALIFALITRSTTRNTYASVMVFLLLTTAIWVVYIINGELYTGSLAKILTIISFADGISYFANGIFNVSSIVMFVSVIVLFNFLTIQSVQKRRWN